MIRIGIVEDERLLLEHRTNIIYVISQPEGN